MKDMESEYIGSSKILTIDEAKNKKGVIGDDAKEFEGEVLSKQDNLFTDIMSVVFGWKIQTDGSRKLVSKLPNGKIIFPDRSEQIEHIEPGVPYISLVYEREREAFAKICSEEYRPKIFVLPSKMVTMVWKEKQGEVRHKMAIGETYETRIVSAIKEMEKLKFPSISVVFRDNQK